MRCGPGGSSALGRLVAEQTALPPNVFDAMTFACTPQTSAATATGTWTVLLDRSTFTRPLWVAADAGAAAAHSARAALVATASNIRPLIVEKVQRQTGLLAPCSARANPRP